MTTQIRPARVEDLPRCVEMARHFLAASSYAGGLIENPAQFADVGARLIDHPESTLLIADRSGEAVGMIGVYVYSHPYSAERFASELFWWVEPDARGCGLQLLRMAEEWAMLHGATRMQVVAPQSNPALGLVYERLGFTELETHYQRTLPCRQV